MLELEILQPGVPAAAAQLPPGAYLVGSGAECHIRLKRPEISSRHAQLIVRDNRHTVFRHPYIKFNFLRAEGNCGAECRKTVFRRNRIEPAMGADAGVAHLFVIRLQR